MLLLAVLKTWHVIGIVALIAVLALYKVISAKYVDQPNQQSDQINMLNKRMNHLENQLTQVAGQLETLLEKQSPSDEKQTHENE